MTRRDAHTHKRGGKIPGTQAVIVPAMTPTMYADRRGHWDVDVVLVTPSGHRHAVGYVDTTGKARRVHGGPEVPGPYGFAYGLAVAITEDPRMSTGAEIHENRARGAEFDVVDGDRIQLGHEVFEVRIERRQWIHLDHVGQAD